MSHHTEKKKDQSRLSWLRSLMKMMRPTLL